MAGVGESLTMEYFVDFKKNMAQSICNAGKELYDLFAI